MCCMWEGTKSPDESGQAMTKNTTKGKHGNEPKDYTSPE